eukprot:SAG31_NODE_4727_length_3001_cov_3.721916_1_plen_422_part_00
MPGDAYALQLLLLVGALATLRRPALAASSDVANDVASLFATWRRQHKPSGHSYGTAAEHSRRLAIFADNHAFIERHNTMRSYDDAVLLGHTQFSDRTHHEFTNMMLSRTSQRHPAPQVDKNLLQLSGPTPAVVDWRDPALNHAGVVGTTGIKNQMWCGSCYAFSATAALECLLAITSKKGPPTSLSEQQLMDCGSHFVPGSNHYCNGGDPMAEFWYVNNTGGICSDADYPYHIQSNSSLCTGKSWPFTPAGCTPVLKIGGELKAPMFNETAMAAAVSKQVVSININAGQRWFAFYKGGIVKDLACNSITNHAVSVVGYGLYPTVGPASMSGHACIRNTTAASTTTANSFVSIGSPSVWPIVNTITMPPNTPGLTARQCADACEANENCSSWGWAPHGHTYAGCWLKSATRDSPIVPGVGLV